MHQVNFTAILESKTDWHFFFLDNSDVRGQLCAHLGYSTEYLDCCHMFYCGHLIKQVGNYSMHTKANWVETLPIAS